MLDLTHRGTLEALDVDPADLLRDDRQLTHEIGEAAQQHRFQAILSASLTGVDIADASFDVASAYRRFTW